MHYSKRSFEQAVLADLEYVLSAEIGIENGVKTGTHEPKRTAQIPKSSTESPRITACSDGSGVPQIWSLASGSKANCTYVTDGSTKLLIDFGLSCRATEKLLRELGTTLSDIDAIFITHEHSDHVAGLPTLLKHHDIPIHMTEPSSLAFIRSKGYEYRDKLTVHPISYTQKIGTLTVSSCQISHDSAACVSYLVKGGDISFCTCTDLGCITDEIVEHISQATSIILESNHDIALLKAGAYPEEIKHRIHSKYGHLSNSDCAELLVRLAESGVRRALLGHISPENNTPELAMMTAIDALESAGLSLDLLDTAPREGLRRLL